MNVLDEIVAHTRREVAELKRRVPLEEIKAQAEQISTDRKRRPFRSLFDSQPVLIAEIKPQSPSEGVLIKESPLDVAALYAKSEADVISVLTDKKYFGGSLELLKEVRAKVPQAILRKDFIVDEYQIYETVLAEADACLLIAAALSTDELKHLRRVASLHDLDTLVEIHSEEELDKALDADADVIGINNRDLKTLKTDLAMTEALMKSVPFGVPSISESGIYTASDVARVRKAGARGILVGTSILQSPDPLAKITELKNALHE